MSTVAVIGAQWGDEGKGKVVDFFGQQADMVVRFQGGNNAGHTIVVDDEKIILHLIPAAALHANKTCLIANGVVVDVEALLKEVDDLKSKNYLQTSKLYVSNQAHVIMPYHKILDKLRENQENSTTIGTTGKGIGPAYADKISRTGIRCEDLLQPEYLRHRLEEILPEKNHLIEHFFSHPPLKLEPLLEELLKLGEKLQPFLRNTSQLIHAALKENKKIMLEGAQGALLDIDYGTYPYVTSSNTTSSGACTGSGLPPSSIDEVIAITKAYTTRVGEGPFPTELTDDTGDLLQKVGKEFGATTGRTRRCGWLDLVALRQTKDICGFTGLALTKIDVLQAVKEIKVCVAYKLDGKTITAPPSSTQDLARVEPVYKTFPSWKTDMSKIKSPEDIPKELQDYIDFIEETLETKAVLLSMGPDRNDTLTLINPF